MSTKKSTKPAKELTEKQKLNAELKAGADKLRKEKAAAKKAAGKKGETQIVPTKPQTPVQLLGKDWEPSNTREEDIIEKRVTMAPGSVGVTIDEATPLEEYPAIIRHFQHLEKCTGFIIGDALNACAAHHGGAKRDAMLAVTGLLGDKKAASTLYAYARTAAAVPIERRQPSLGFAAHRAVARIENPEKQMELLTDAAEVVESGKKFTVKDMKKAADKAEPPKKKSPTKKAASGKGKSSGKPAPEPEKYTDEEQAIYDDVLAKLGDLDELLGSKAGQDFLSKTIKVDNKLKRPLTARGKWITRFLTTVESRTGY